MQYILFDARMTEEQGKQSARLNLLPGHVESILLARDAAGTMFMALVLRFLGCGY